MRRQNSDGSKPPSRRRTIILRIISAIILGSARVAIATRTAPPIAPRIAATIYPVGSGWLSFILTFFSEEMHRHALVTAVEYD